jgi:hypothetical protein
MSEGKKGIGECSRDRGTEEIYIELSQSERAVVRRSNRGDLVSPA